MSTMYIEEFAEADRLANGLFPRAPAIAVQHISFTGTPGVSAAFNAETKYVRIHCDGIASLLFSTAGTAAAVTDPRVAASVDQFRSVRPNTGMKVSAITNT
jgi:hypothetical protein